MPACLRKSRDAIGESFVELEWAQNHRYLEGRQQPHSPSGKPASPWARMTGTEITKRNRYANIDPFHSNRVKLRVKDGESDYINASPIVLGNKSGSGAERRYIACQGPTVSSAPHMWRMIAQNTADPAVIVMLTQTHEGSREKCWPYFPTDPAVPMLLHRPSKSGYTGAAHANLDRTHVGTDDDFQGTVTLLDSRYDDSTHSTIRTLRLDTFDPSFNNGATGAKRQSKTVIHYLFERWPDFGVPMHEDRDALLNLIRQTNSACKQPAQENMPSAQAGVSSTSEPRYNPRIIHCSAGVGRSGTFIALDYLLAEMEAGALDGLDDEQDVVADTVDTLRQQRMMMVQGEEQFRYLYATLREEWTKRAQRPRA